MKFPPWWGSGYFLELHIADGRGRKLKCEEFPELARYIEFAFGEGDRVLRGGGGLEADRRLLDTTLFKAADNATASCKRVDKSSETRF